MSRASELTLFSYEVLGLVGEGGASAHDLRSMVARGRILAWAGESQYYAEPKRLARLGYLAARREPGKTRERTVYTLTAKGRKALREYALTPARFTPLKSEPLLRFLIADLVGDEATLAGLRPLRAELDDLRERLELAVASAEGLPHRRAYLLIVTDFLARYLDLHDELLDRAERELG